MKPWNIIIIGAGPAGLFAALNYSSPGRRVLLLEKNSSAGKKFLLSGSGQCNVTHTGNIPEFIKHYGKAGNFVRPALSSFPPESLMEFLNSNGIPTITRDDGKVFPGSLRASDILAKLLTLCTERGVVVRYSSPATGIGRDTGLFSITAGGEELKSERVLISAGGESYPSTGSEGDGVKLAALLGHTIVPGVPALTPVTATGYLFSGLAGISLKNREIRLLKAGGGRETGHGDILFTHQGLSGPGILDLSRYIESGDRLEISLTGIDAETMTERFITESRSSGNKNIKNYLKTFDLPENLVEAILRMHSIPPQKNISEISKGERTALFRSLGSFPFTVEEKGDFRKAMATAGGVARDEIDRITMESKIVPGLFFAGEVIDVDGDTGGYNIQWAFSSAKAAAEGILKTTTGH